MLRTLEKKEEGGFLKYFKKNSLKCFGKELGLLLNRVFFERNMYGFELSEIAVVLGQV